MLNIQNLNYNYLNTKQHPILKDVFWYDLSFLKEIEFNYLNSFYILFTNSDLLFFILFLSFIILCYLFLNFSMDFLNYKNKIFAQGSYFIDRFILEKAKTITIYKYILSVYYYFFKDIIFKNNNKYIYFNKKVIDRIIYFLYFFFILYIYIYMYIIKFNLNLIYATFMINYDNILFNKLNLTYTLWVDGLSLPFLLLTSFIFFLCYLYSLENVKYSYTYFIFLLIILQIILMNIFMVSDIFLFYILFESVLIPMYIIIGYWGTRYRKIYAANMFFLYTYIGSILFFLSILYLMVVLGSTDYFYLLELNKYLSTVSQYFLWLGFFISFCVKVPMYPFHIWLPEAHVEAPTIGSVILAALLLKLGTYGLVRYSLFLFLKGFYFFRPFVLTLALLGVVYTSIITLRQIDLKKIIAYSSVAHMNLVVLGIFSNNVLGITGAIFLMLSHGLVSAALFFLIGILYERYHTRFLFFYQNLTDVMPMFSLFFCYFSFCNISFPLTSGFVGELLIFMGVFELNPFITILSLLSLFFGAVYTLWLYNRIAFGKFTKVFNKYVDLTRIESFILKLLAWLTLYFGIFPSKLLKVISFYLYCYFF